LKQGCNAYAVMMEAETKDWPVPYYQRAIDLGNTMACFNLGTSWHSLRERTAMLAKLLNVGRKVFFEQVIRMNHGRTNLQTFLLLNPSNKNCLKVLFQTKTSMPS